MTCTELNTAYLPIFCRIIMKISTFLTVAAALAGTLDTNLDLQYTVNIRTEEYSKHRISKSK